MFSVRFIADCKSVFQEGGCSVPVAVNTNVQDGKVCNKI